MSLAANPTAGLISVLGVSVLPAWVKVPKLDSAPFLPSLPVATAVSDAAGNAFTSTVNELLDPDELWS